MTATLELSRQEDVYDVTGQTSANDARANADHVGVIVKPCHARTECVGANRGAHSTVTVGGDGHPDPRPTHQNSACEPSVDDALRKKVREVRVID